MAKQGRHEHDANDPRISKGPNNPSQSQIITTGSYKKQETYKRQAAEHKDVARPAQAAKNEWNPDTRDKPTIAGATRARRIRSGRSGSDCQCGRRHARPLSRSLSWGL
ncbi:MAG: hypothetical protein QOF51_3524 [Chloroflexota bacterium]|nr:hypothetical protein [Chloroflexota bacterium]